MVLVEGIAEELAIALLAKEDALLIAMLLPAGAVAEYEARAMAQATEARSLVTAISMSGTV